MNPTSTSVSVASNAFESSLIDFINGPLAESDRRGIHTFDVNADTPLFESGLIDSLAIVQLIAFIERRTGRAIPHRLLVMKHFRTVNTITRTFASP